jgi:antirestriction protein ArdC
MNLYEEITSKIIEQLEQGIIPWEKPWTGTKSGAISRSTGRPYSFINQMLLGKPGEYMTFNQCKQEGGMVKKGSKAKMVVFWKIIRHEVKDAFGNLVKDKDGSIKTENFPCLKYFQVFHIDDCEGIEPKFTEEQLAPIDPIGDAEKVIAGYVTRSGVRLEHCKQDRAYYSPSRDIISLPLKEQFATQQGYYETLFHEATHSTGHKSRLDRFADSTSAAAFGDVEYSKEELVAEIGSCAIMNTLGIETHSSFRNTVAYIQSWLKVLRNDNKMIVSAAGKAEKAANMILGVQ